MTLALTGITTAELFVVPVPSAWHRLSSPCRFTALLLFLSSYLFPWRRNLGARDWQVSLTEEIRWHSSPVAPSITELFDLCKPGTPTRSKTSTTRLLGTKIVRTEDFGLVITWWSFLWSWHVCINIQQKSLYLTVYIDYNHNNQIWYLNARIRMKIQSN